MLAHAFDPASVVGVTAPGEGARRLSPVSTARQELGELGERIAARWLSGRGWDVLARRFRNGHRDLDLVVRREEVVAFVEVKTRRKGGFGGPVGAVGWRKQRELTRSAQVWMDRQGKELLRGGGAPVVGYRFDVVGVLIGADRRVRVLHVPDAFPAHLRG